MSWGRHKKRLDYSLEYMFLLREEGWAYAEIARYFDLDHTTVMYHCKKNGIKQLKKIDRKNKSLPAPPPPEPNLIRKKTQSLKKQRPRGYMDYLREAINRKIDGKIYKGYGIKEEDVKSERKLQLRRGGPDPR